jgi:hypothetical protein
MPHATPGTADGDPWRRASAAVVIEAHEQVLAADELGMSQLVQQGTWSRR